MTWGRCGEQRWGPGSTGDGEKGGLPERWAEGRPFVERRLWEDTEMG